MAPRAAAVSTHHRRRAAAYRDFVTSHGRHPRLVTDSAAGASLARWLVRLMADGEANELVASVEGLIVPAEAQRTTEESVTVECVRFGYIHLRVPSRSAKDARERMLASWRADVVADPEHRDHMVLSGLAERITNRRHEVALVAMLEHKIATGKVVNNRSDAALYGRCGEPEPLGPMEPCRCSVSGCWPTWRASSARCDAGDAPGLRGLPQQERGRMPRPPGERWRACDATSVHRATRCTI